MIDNVALPLVIHYVLLHGIFGSGREDRVITATAAIQQAHKIQPTLQRSGKCPATLDGWSPDPEHGHGVLATRVMETNTMLTLECDQAERRFSVTIHWFVDDHAYVEGPFDGPLTITYGHFTAPESRVVPVNPDIRALSRLLAYGGA